MRRREVITLVGGLAAVWPFVARAQQRLPVVAIFNGQSAAEVKDNLDAFRQSLNAEGFVEGRNVSTEYVYAEGNRELLPKLAAEIVSRQVSVIMTAGGTPVAVAAKRATQSIPIVFAMGGDPVALGIVKSLNHPGGNATGACFLFNELGAKRVELMRQAVPTLKSIGYLVNPTNPSLDSESRDMQAAILSAGLQLHLASATTEQTIEAAFKTFSAARVDAVITAADVFFTVHREKLVTLASRYKLPMSCHSRELVQAGALMAYGPSQRDGYRQAGTYTGRILKGERPSELPVQLATSFELVLNLKTAKELGITMTSTMLTAADEVIE
jgi:ABC-type uncharacterized transport system substrate-binding protein